MAAPPRGKKFRQAIWAHVREQGLDQMREERKGGARPEIIAFFRDHDLGFRIRRLRFMARRLTETADTTGPELQTAIGVMRNAIYSALAIYQESEASDSYSEVMILSAEATAIDPEHALAELAEARNLKAKDLAVEEMLAGALATLPKAERRAMLLAYLGFPFYDIATLPLLQGEGLDEFDPIKVDRISPTIAPRCALRRRGGDAERDRIQQFRRVLQSRLSRERTISGDGSTVRSG
jgi:hypothetical protein